MKRVATAVVLLTAFAIATAAAQGSQQGPQTADAANPVKLTIWVPWTARELNEFKKVVAEYDKPRPNVEVKVVGNISDDKITAAIRAGNAPDVVTSWSSDNVGAYCGSGAWMDLGPMLRRAKIDMSQFPKTTLYYTQYKGKRCALPLLADVRGLYYNKELFRKAGLSGPPQTFAQLTDYAKKLTVRNADGSLKVVGFNPTLGFYQNTMTAFAPLFGAKWVNAKGNSSLATDPAWSKFFRWQKSLVDYYGYSRLVKFNAGAGDEWSASNAFESGKLAMHLDGEWRVAFIANEKPQLQYGTAAMPTDKPELYGSGYITGTIIGIPKGAKKLTHSWLLVRYLTTNSRALALFSNGIRNVPTTRASASHPALKPDENFSTFLKIFAHPKSSTHPITATGAAYQELAASFAAKWQAGRVKDLRAGLKKLDKQIDAQRKQAEGPGTP
jgi:multiple sugar transport system substrate-binding protein